MLTLRAACRSLLLVAGLLTVATPLGAAERLPRVLVVPFGVRVTGTQTANPGSTAWLSEVTAVLLSQELRAAGTRTVSRDERVAAFDRLQLPLTSPLTRATVLRVAELIGATEVVFGDVTIGDTVAITARMVRLDEARELPAATDQGAAADLAPICARLAKRLSSETGRPPEPSIIHPLPPIPYAALQNYAKGLVATTPAAQQRFLEQALKQAPGDARILLALAAVYSAQGSHDRALAATTAVPADSPLSRQAHFATALSLIDLSRFDGASRELSALAKDRPAAVLSNALGVAAIRKGVPGGPTGATTYFRQAVDQEPGNTQYLFNLGYAYALAHDDTAALSWLREAVRYDAALGDAHLVMSAILMSNGRQVEAGRELDLAKLLGTGPDAAALQLSDKVPARLERLPTLLDAPAQPALQASIEAPAQRAQEQTAAFYLAQGKSLAADRRDRDAIAALRRAVYLSPYDDEPHILLGTLYRRAGRLTEAIDELKVAIWCRETAAAHVALGGALLDAGETAAARREAERAVALDPQSADARALLKRAGGDRPTPAPVLSEGLVPRE